MAERGDQGGKRGGGGLLSHACISHHPGRAEQSRADNTVRFLPYDEIISEIRNCKPGMKGGKAAEREGGGEREKKRIKGRGRELTYGPRERVCILFVTTYVCICCK